VNVQGRVWKFGHNVDTDVITPGKYLYMDMKELAKHTLEVLDPEFATKVQPGDCVLGGRNFGCGSSREHAPRVLKLLGVSCVVAETFARIFQRNAIAIGLPVLAVPGLWAQTEAGDELEIDLASGAVLNRRTSQRLRGHGLPERMLSVLREGGIVPALKRLGAEQSAEHS
jgi:3-isopropylmalate/(R)-2-methylmalate dehydratase small subunit